MRIRRRIEALRLAKQEYDTAMYFDDWRERRVLFRAMDLLDTSDDPRAEVAYYLFQDRLKELNLKTGRWSVWSAEESNDG